MAKLSADDRRALVEKNLKLAYFLAAKFHGLGVEAADLDQTAILAMCEAAKSFDSKVIARARFGAFARSHVLGRLRHAVARESRRRAIEASLAASMEPIVPPPRDLTNADLDELVREAIDLLPSRQRTIIVRRFGLDGKPPWTVMETAEHLRATVANVKRATEAARRVISFALRSHGLTADRYRAIRIKMG